jgi:exopolysaccharide production protein ExoY
VSTSLSVTAHSSRDPLWTGIYFVERIGAAAGLAAVAPLLALCGAMIFALSRRTPFVAHLRVGQHAAPLWVLKLRTMWNDPTGSTGHLGLVERISDDDGPLIKSAEDLRVTSRFARFCRKYSLDELPQLLHVVRGEMSLVGPRPLTEGELRRYYGGDTAEVVSIRPGITGLWQVMGRSLLSYRQRLRLDVFFVRRRSLALYLWILIKTLPVALSGRGSV